jgi:glycosyltransferase involved in cell wall biosynthesis
MKKKSLLFIPAYNEATSISVILKKALDSHILDLITIIDDASQDNTIETVK